ncbi:hypothetical protein L596_005024 [Steinernema carpocapsae]|uniref:Uncharacterized protein n=1 Tax=Steinernema carpocapsae TaxID=34508 RepID=A0A4U8UZ88_STECR|nr:hypothetical protein L596_005024 [Steinernema carpocapsae]
MSSGSSVVGTEGSFGGASQASIQAFNEDSFGPKHWMKRCAAKLLSPSNQEENHLQNYLVSFAFRIVHIRPHKLLSPDKQKRLNRPISDHSW